MDDDHVDGDQKSKNNVDSVFTLFSDLIGEKNENPKYCLSLIKSLHREDFSVGSGSNLEYSVKRLLRGLGSTRIYSQCGCFAALTCVLKYKACLVETVLQALKREQRQTKGATKSEMRSLTSACALTCGAIIHSGLFQRQSKEVQEDILKKLIEAGKKKSYLLAVIIHFLIDVVNLVDDEQFKNTVWPICKSELMQNLTECSPDVFYLLLVCFKKNEKSVFKFLHKNFISSDMLIEVIFKSLLGHCVKCDHPIYDNLGWFFCKYATSPVELWSKCINENIKANLHKDIVIVTIFSYIIKHLIETKILPNLLVPKLLETFMKVISVKKYREHKDSGSKVAKFALNAVISVLCSEDTSHETRFESVQKLLFYPGNLKFEMITGTKCINTLVSQLSCDFTKKVMDIYKQVVSGELKKKIDESGTEENWNSKEKQLALHHFTKTLNHPSLRDEIHWKLCEIKFIFEVGFLNKYQLSSEIQKCAKDCFYKAIMVQMPSLKELILFLDELALLINENIKSRDFKTSKEVENFWDKMYSAVESLKRKESNKLYSAVHVFLIYMGLHLFVDCELAKGGIDELVSCYKHLKESQKKQKSEDEKSPHWTEVTVDLILSLLSRENKLWRHVVSCVFPQVVTQITPTGLNQIIDALDPKSCNDVLSHVNSDDSDGESEEDSESSLSEAKESDLEGADEETKPSDQLRLAVRNALGYSAAHTDDESIDMDQMDEEEERRLNESLSEAFRQFRSNSQLKKKKQTREEEALTHFRLRVLDLVEIYIASSPPMIGCLDLILPLFDLLELSIKNHHQQPLQNRVDSILRNFFTLKTFSNTENVNQKIIKDVFHSIISRKETSALVFVEMSPRISDCTTFLVRCSQHVPNDGSNIPLVDEYESLLKSFFHSRDFKLPISAFQAILRTSWKGNFKIVATLFQLLISPDVRIFKKIKIIELLRIFYKNDKLRCSCDETSKLELRKTETNFIYNFVDFVSDYEKTESQSTVKMYLSFFSNVIALINVIQSSCRRYPLEKENSKIPPWRNLVEKMAETEAIICNKKTRSQLGNLASAFKMELPTSGKIKRKRTLSESSDHIKAEGKGLEEQERRKKKKKLSPEKRKLKKESQKLREEISSNGLAMVRFSMVDSRYLPEPGMNEEEELSVPKKKRREKVLDLLPLKRITLIHLGYANEVGEAFRPLVHKYWVIGSYGIATLYVIADTMDKTLKADKKEKNMPIYRKSRVVTAAADTLIWQSLASVVIPGFTINRICAITLYSLSKFTKLPASTKKWTTTAVGLGSIPFIVKPIDSFVDLFLDKLLRPFFPN